MKGRQPLQTNILYRGAKHLDHTFPQETGRRNIFFGNSTLPHASQAILLISILQIAVIMPHEYGSFTMASNYRPRLWRLLIAFLVAPTVTSICLSAILLLPVALAMASRADNGSFQDFMQYLLGMSAFFTVIGVFPSFLLGGPLYMFLVRRVRPDRGNCAMTGSFIASGTWGFIMISRKWTGGVIDDKMLLVTIAFIIAGAIGGLAFRACAIWRDPRLGNGLPGEL